MWGGKPAMARVNVNAEANAGSKIKEIEEILLRQHSPWWEWEHGNCIFAVGLLNSISCNRSDAVPQRPEALEAEMGHMKPQISTQEQHKSSIKTLPHTSTQKLYWSPTSMPPRSSLHLVPPAKEPSVWNYPRPMANHCDHCECAARGWSSINPSAKLQAAAPWPSQRPLAIECFASSWKHLAGQYAVQKLAYSLGKSHFQMSKNVKLSKENVESTHRQYGSGQGAEELDSCFPFTLAGANQSVPAHLIIFQPQIKQGCWSDWHQQGAV